MVDGPRILSLDIETSPIIAHNWGLWNQNIGINQIIEHPRVICFAAKFLDERKVHFFSEFHHGPVEMVQRAHELLDEADIVMHYNGDKFDLPRLNKEILLQGRTPPSPYKSIDLLKVMRQNFGFPSNKLAYISEQLGLTGKIKHEGHELWIKCLAGDPKAWAKMRRYNVQDAKLLEELYEKVKPWIKTHPNMGLYVDSEDTVCPTCGSLDLERRGYAVKTTGKYQRYRCRSCGSWPTATRRVSGVNIA